jgi:hypothetical protein
VSLPLNAHEPTTYLLPSLPPSVLSNRGAHC